VDPACQAIIYSSGFRGIYFETDCYSAWAEEIYYRILKVIRACSGFQ
jgi:hypothetical protein